MSAADGCLVALALAGVGSWWQVRRRREHLQIRGALSTWKAHGLDAFFSVSLTLLATLVVGLALVTWYPALANAAFPVALAVGSWISLRVSAERPTELFVDLRSAPRLALVTLLRASPFIVIAMLIGSWIWQNQEQRAIEMLRSSSGATKVLLSFCTCLLAPIGEELFFRGLIYRWLRGRMPFAAAAAVSAALFAVFHLTPAVSLALFVFGLAAAFSAEASGGMATPILFHIVFNSLQLALLFAS